MNDRTSMRDRAAAAAWLGALALSPAATGKTSPPTASSASPSALPRASAVPSTAAIPGPSASSTAAPQPAPDGPRRLTPATIHALLAAALRQAGLERDDALDALAARARWSGLVPEVRLRALRSADSGVRLYRTDEAADRWSGSDGASSLFEGRLTFRLDRFVFDEQEIALERVRVERVELRQRLTHRIVELAMRWTRARRLELDVDALPREREEALATELETLVGLDALTGGLASRLLAATATLTVTP